MNAIVPIYTIKIHVYMFVLILAVFSQLYVSADVNDLQILELYSLIYFRTEININLGAYQNIHIVCSNL